jgi:hypothetical protein
MSSGSCSSAPERYSRRLSARQFESQKGARQPAVRPPGSLGGNAQRGLRTATRRTMVAQCSPSATEPEGPRVASPNSMRRKPSHPDAKGIADDGGDENGKHQRPAAKVAIEVHRIRFASKRPQARPARKRRSRERRPHASPLTILLFSSPVRSFVAALRALIEDHVFPAIERRLDTIDMHGLKDVAGRAMNECGKQVADVCERL